MKTYITTGETEKQAGSTSIMEASMRRQVIYEKHITLFPTCGFMKTKVSNVADVLIFNEVVNFWKKKFLGMER